MHKTIAFYGCMVYYKNIAEGLASKQSDYMARLQYNIYSVAHTIKQFAEKSRVDKLTTKCYTVNSTQDEYIGEIPIRLNTRMLITVHNTPLRVAAIYSKVSRR